MRKTILHFDSFPPSPNTRRHYIVVAKDNRKWKEEAGWQAKVKHQGAPFKRASLHYHFATGDKRRMDADNLIASTKPITDGLKGIVLVDDDIDSIAVTYTFSRDKPRRITLTITEVQ